MPDLHVYLPSDLAARLDRELPADVSLSELAQRAFTAELERRGTCRHTRIKCADCGGFLG